jgi:hypothetical protein
VGDESYVSAERHAANIEGMNRPVVAGGSHLERMEPMDRRTRYPAEVKERAVRMVFDHGSEHDFQWALLAVSHEDH